MTDRLRLNKSESYTLHIGGTAHLLSIEELEFLRDRLDIILGKHGWEIGTSFRAHPDKEPPREVWLMDKDGDCAGWVDSYESANGHPGWSWVKWGTGPVTRKYADPWAEFAPGREFTVVEAK